MAALFVAASSSAYSQGVVVSAVQIGGNPDRVAARFTGEIFDHPNLGTGYTVPPFDEDVASFTDRTHQWNGAAVDLPLPRYLVGNEYIMMANDNRAELPFQVDITISDESFVYLLVDNRLAGSANNTPPDFSFTMMWVAAEGWEPMITGHNRARSMDVPDEVAVDEAGDGVGPGAGLNQWASVYVKRVPAGTFSIFESENPGRNMYGVVLQPVPKQPYLTTASGSFTGFSAEILDGSESGVVSSSVAVTLNGESVNADVVKTGDRTTIEFASDGPLPSGSANTVVVTFEDDASPANALSETFEFSVQQYASVPAAWRVTSPTEPGMTVRVYHPGVPRPGGESIWAVENSLAGKQIDSATGEPYVNLVSPDTLDINLVNWEQNFGEIGLDPTAGPDFFNSARPGLFDPRFNEGIPGVFTPDPDHLATEVYGFIELPGGLSEMGVVSDDGFRLSIFSGTPDVMGTVLGQFDGGRGAAESRFALLVEEAGVYPFRFTWWEGTSGANVEWYSFDQSTGDRVLINDPIVASSLKTYRSATGASPVVRSVYPFQGTPTVPVTTPIEIVLANGPTRTVDAESIELIVNGSVMTPTVASVGGQVTITQAPAPRWPFSSTVSVELRYSEVGSEDVRSVVSTFDTAAPGPGDVDPENLVIVSAEQIGGNPTREPARFSGEVFDHPNLGAGYMVPLFGEDVAAFTDRVHQWNGPAANVSIPPYLMGAEYIMMANDNRSELPFQVDITLSDEAFVYLLIDNRLGGTANNIPPDFSLAMGWVATQGGWEQVFTGHNRTGDPQLPDEIGADEGAGGVGPGVSLEQYATIYVKRMPAGTFSLFEADNPGRNMYGVVVRRVPTQIILSADQIGGRQDRPPAKFTGETFDHGHASIGAGYTVPAFDENVAAFTDRNHQWNGAATDVPLPDYLVGSEYIMMANDNRDQVPFQVDVSVSESALIYLLIDNRLGDGDATNPPDFTANMTWVPEQGWEPVRTGQNRTGDMSMPDEVGVDEGAGGTAPGESIENFASVYVRRVPMGTFSIFQADNAGRNMYGVVVGEVPSQPYFGASSANQDGFSFEILDGANSSVVSGSVEVTLNGDSAEVLVTKEGFRTTVVYSGAVPLPVGSHTVVLTAQDNATPPNTLTSTLEFTIEDGGGSQVIGISVDTEGNLVLTWDGDGVLSVGDSVDGSFSPVEGASSPHTVVPDATQRYYKLE